MVCGWEHHGAKRRGVHRGPCVTTLAEPGEGDWFLGGHEEGWGQLRTGGAVVLRPNAAFRSSSCPCRTRPVWPKTPGGCTAHPLVPGRSPPWGPGARGAGEGAPAIPRTQGSAQDTVPPHTHTPQPTGSGVTSVFRTGTRLLGSVTRQPLPHHGGVCARAGHSTPSLGPALHTSARPPAVGGTPLFAGPPLTAKRLGGDGWACLLRAAPESRGKRPGSASRQGASLGCATRVALKLGVWPPLWAPGSAQRLRSGVLAPRACPALSCWEQPEGASLMSARAVTLPV